MKIVELENWADFFQVWTGALGPMGGAPPRELFTLEGRIGDGARDDSWFHIGRARDRFGTAIHLDPDIAPLVAKAKGALDRDWRRAWAKAAVRAGYLSPTVDPVAFARLSEARRRRERLEFIVDTNVLVSGVGHWLVRWLGDIADLVRTVVTDLELAAWVDGMSWQPDGHAELDRRTRYLAASRFLECMADRHPIWRRLDTQEEAALFIPKVSINDKGKQTGTDALILRAARRLLLDQVPRLQRFFVTGDQALARAAMHDLPAGSVVTAYVNPINEAGAFLSSTHWWPDGSEFGSAFISRLAEFVYEATCICDEIRIESPDGRRLFVAAHSPGHNQFPSHWQSPVLWIREEAQAASAKGGREVVTTRKGNAEATGVIKESRSASGDNALLSPFDPRWPLRRYSPLSPAPCASRVSIEFLLECLTSMMTSIRDERPLSKKLIAADRGLYRETRTFLRATDFLTKDAFGPASFALVDLFRNGDVDGLMLLLSRASNFQALLNALHGTGVDGSEVEGVPPRSLSSMIGLARALGQAVSASGQVYCGGGFVEKGEFSKWLYTTIDQIAAETPLGEAPLPLVAGAALHELHLSPVRFTRALEALIQGGELIDLDFSAGGTPEDILVEVVCALTTEGATRRRFGADNIMGFRTVKRK